MAHRFLTILVCAVASAAACAAPLSPRAEDAVEEPESVTSRPTPVSLPTTSLPPIVTAAPTPPPVTAPVVTVEYRIENRSLDPSAAGFAAVVQETLSAPIGWQQAGFALAVTPEASNLVVLAEPDEAQMLCMPYDVYRKYSCQNGPLVVLNAERWRDATPEWTADLAAYRQMLVNHEFGHLLGQRHVPCGPPGALAPVMCQQSTELKGALANPWPLAEEIARAARHDEPIAPAFGQ